MLEFEPDFERRSSFVEFDGNTHQDIINRFRLLDCDLFQHNRALVAQAHWLHLPRGPGGGQIGVLRREFEKKRRHLPLRKLMTDAGNAVLQIKPVFMMSPLSIAKFIPPGSVRFDLVIFDEASQVRPVDAMGAGAASVRIAFLLVVFAHRISIHILALDSMDGLQKICLTVSFQDSFY